MRNPRSLPSSLTPPGETPSAAPGELSALLSFRPDRVGHALFLPPSSRSRLSALQIPVECCPTSNVLTVELSAGRRHEDLVEGLRNHPGLKDWLTSHHPLVVCTDDPGVFGTDSSEEFRLVWEVFFRDRENGFREMADLVLRGIDFIFDPDARSNQELREGMEREMDRLVLKFSALNNATAGV